MPRSSTREHIAASKHLSCVHLDISGVVQGVGFRPFVYRLANELGIKGFITNTLQGVEVEAEHFEGNLQEFINRLRSDHPPLASIENIEQKVLTPQGFVAFEIKQSQSFGKKKSLLLPDVATCSDCLSEIFDSTNRRYHYPFTNCTNCGPRFSIIESLPYDRGNTTMKIFTMCKKCRQEYEDPANRRFHAQPNACPDCGPNLQLWNSSGESLSSDHRALLEAIAALRQGQIVAIKGLGGFHMMVDAQNPRAIEHLRIRKHRSRKPFAVMYPSLAAVEADCVLNELERTLLLAPESPIVIVERREHDCTVSEFVAPGNPFIGVMLPYTPLHHILMREFGAPLIATSGNLAEEPICTDEFEALKRLNGVADLFLVHNRPIKRHVDDSIVRVLAGKPQILRRARGFAPLPVKLAGKIGPATAVGAHLKNTVAIAIDDNVFISQHIGDLESLPSYKAFEEVLVDLSAMYEHEPSVIVHDLHPDYLSSQYARKTASPLLGIQHHYAHVLSCMAENHLDAPVLGISWDGTGFGTDGTIWGGEFLSIDRSSFIRSAFFEPFRLPGGDIAIKEAKRSALGVLYGVFGEELFNLENASLITEIDPLEVAILHKMLANGINSPLTSSVGRLFDAVASILGLCHISSFEGEAAMAVEFSARRSCSCSHYDFELVETAGDISVDWRPAIRDLVQDKMRGSAVEDVAAKFHATLVEILIRVARRVGIQSVALTGGCFQNKLLCELAIKRLSEEGFTPYWHHQVPPNDGGIALGQIAAAARVKIKE